MEPRLRHQAEQTERLEGDGLASRVGPGDHEERLVAAHAEIHGDHRAFRRLPGLREQEGVPSSHDLGHALLAENRLGRFHLISQLGSREGQVEPSHVVHQGFELGQGLPHRVGERLEHAQHLDLFLAGCLDQVVVVLDHALGLHEEGGPALRAIVHDALEARLGLRADGQDVAAVSHRDVALLEDQVRPGAMEVGFEALHEIAPQLAALLPELPQRRTGFVTHSAVGIERAAQEIGERLEARQAREGPREIGRLGGDGAAVGGEARGGVEQGKQSGDLGAFGHGAGDTGALEELANVGDGFPGRAAGDGHGLTAFACFGEGRLDGAQVSLRLET